MAYLSVVDRAIASEWFYFQLPDEKKKSLKEKQACVCYSVLYWRRESSGRPLRGLLVLKESILTGEKSP